MISEESKKAIEKINQILVDSSMISEESKKAIEKINQILVDSSISSYHITNLEIINFYNDVCCNYDDFENTFQKELKYIEDQIIKRFDIGFISNSQTLDFKKKIFFDEIYSVLYFEEDFKGGKGYSIPSYISPCRIIHYKRLFKSLDKQVKINGYLNNFLCIFFMFFPAFFFKRATTFEIYIHNLILSLPFWIFLFSSKRYNNYIVAFDFKDKKIRNRHKSLKFQLETYKIVMKTFDSRQKMKDAGDEARRKKSK